MFYGSISSKNLDIDNHADMIELMSEFTMHLDKTSFYIDKLEIEDNEFLKNVQFDLFCSTA